MARPVTVGLNLTANKACTCYYSDVSATSDIYIMQDKTVSSKSYEKIDGGSYIV